jgi:hypothetical protein
MLYIRLSAFVPNLCATGAELMCNCEQIRSNLHVWNAGAAAKAEIVTKARAGAKAKPRVLSQQLNKSNEKVSVDAFSSSNNCELRLLWFPASIRNFSHLCFCSVSFSRKKRTDV